MIGWNFKKYIPSDGPHNHFERLFEIFQEVLLYTSGDVSEALSWMTAIDKEHQLTTEEYGMADFINELKERGYLKENKGQKGSFDPSKKMEISLRQKALEDIFQDLQKSKRGDHSIKKSGLGDEMTSGNRPFQFGDSLDKISLYDSIKNAQVNHGIDNFMLTENDLEVRETYDKTNSSTVLMIDISHSMILYGEDRITPAKKVAMALAELIRTRYPKDTLDIIVFGNDSWAIEVKDLPYLQVGPYHTNTISGLELALNILQKKKTPNKQIMMITDGKPTCMKKGKKYYKNSFGLDRKILNRTLGLAVKCRKLNIPITTFMIARDPFLVQFVEKFTKANHGKAFYSSLDGLGEFIFKDYKQGKRKK